MSRKKGGASFIAGSSPGNHAGRSASLSLSASAALAVPGNATKREQQDHQQSETKVLAGGSTHRALRSSRSARGISNGPISGSPRFGGTQRRPSAVRGPDPVELLLPLQPLLFLLVEQIPIARGLRRGWLRRICPGPERDRARAEDESRDDGEGRDQPTRHVASRIEAAILRPTGLAPGRIARPHPERLPLLRAGSTLHDRHDGTGTRARVVGRPGDWTLVQGPL